VRDVAFSRLVDAVVLGVASSVVGGCGGLDTDGIEPLECVEESPDEPAVGSQQPDWLGAVAPAQELDAIEMWWTGEGTTRADVRVECSRGELCAGASDRTACEDAVNAIVVPSPGFPWGDCMWGSCAGYVLVGTTGDEVVVLDDADDVRAWLGEIDTPVEAAWAARVGGYDVGCGERPPIGTGDERWGVRAAGDSYEVLATDHVSICEPYQVDLVLLHVAAAGTVEEMDRETVVDDDGMCATAGRRPAAWRGRGGRGASAAGAHLARLAELEAASIVAFAQLERELAHHGAPRSLRSATRRARRDEVRHALATRGLARRFGGERPPHRPSSMASPRSLAAIAIDNAVEGCAREAYGAVVARWQSLHARDHDVRSALGRIARDESRHAALSLRLDRWLRSRLSLDDRTAVERSRRAAFDELRQSVTVAPAADLVETLGLPPPAVARALLDQLAARLA
jgi:hypothetical protein